MAERPKPATWLPYAGLFLAGAGVVYQGGQLTRQVQQQDQRITKLEAADVARTAAMNDLNILSARNETKLDFLVQQAKEQQEGARRR